MMAYTNENTYLAAGEVTPADVDKIFKSNPLVEFIKLSFDIKGVKVIERRNWNEFKEFLKTLETEAINAA